MTDEELATIKASAQNVAGWTILSGVNDTAVDEACTILRLLAEVERLRAALEQYADSGNWQTCEGEHINQWVRFIGHGDGDEIAQRALAANAETASPAEGDVTGEGEG